MATSARVEGDRVIIDGDARENRINVHVSSNSSNEWEVVVEDDAAGSPVVPGAGCESEAGCEQGPSASSAA